MRTLAMRGALGEERSGWEKQGKDERVPGQKGSDTLLKRLNAEGNAARRRRVAQARRLRTLRANQFRLVTRRARSADMEEGWRPRGVSRSFMQTKACGRS